MKYRNKHIRKDRMGEDTDDMDKTKTTKISLSFPMSAGPAGFSEQKHCPLIQPPSSSTAFDKDSSNRSAWKKEILRVEHLSKGIKSDYISGPPSSTRSTDLPAPLNKSCKPTVSFSVAGSSSHFPTAAVHTSGRINYSRETSGAGRPEEYPEHSTSETAHILFNLSAKAYQGQVIKDMENVNGKNQKGNSLHVELSLPLPSINPPSSSSSPPPLSPSSVSPLNLTPPSINDTYQAEPKPELLCGVCHRLFSTASSLTVHMRLHRGGRLLSCRHCGKTFIHNKRLQSHEATCRHALPALPIQPKDEPLEEGELKDMSNTTDPEQNGRENGPGRPTKRVKGSNGHHVRTLSHSDDLRDEDHFVKVIDGHIIYFCSVCERSYMTLSSLKRHSNVHSWRRKYPCHYCDKVFALAEYRTKHEVWHTGERRYQCIFCWEAFPTYYNLKTHQKASHGISPGLISSEKTANGGYKQKVNALKLYHLLPMRSQKRSYKTYNQALAGELKPDQSGNHSLPLSCSLPPNLDSNKLESFLKDINSQGIKPDPDHFFCDVDTAQCKKPVTSQTNTFEKVTKRERSDLLANISGKAKTVKDSKAAVSSVITFGHSKPSVIVHSTAQPSSVIVQKNKIHTENANNPPETSQAIDKSVHKPHKKPSQKEHSLEHGRWDASSSSTEASETQQITKKLYKAHKSYTKSESSDIVPISLSSEVKGSGPLCQITVRIGEEAIVKRSISETDLMRDKCLSLTKDKNNNISHGDQREQRHNHHHHHKRQKHYSGKQEGSEGEPKWKKPKLPGKVRKYFFRQEVREERNDHDGEDKLWRPYYSYKPKKKVLHMQKIKSWQQKMHYKQSRQLIKRRERLMNHLEKDCDNLEEKGEKVQVEKQKNVQQTEIIDHIKSHSANSITEQKEEENLSPKKLDTSFSTSSSQSILNTQHTVFSPIKHHWSGDQPSHCGSCGRWFSSSRKRDKHELTHLFEFVCLLCRAPFPSQTKLEEHQKTSHPKTKSPLTSAPCNSSSKEIQAVELKDTGNVLNTGLSEKSSPSRLGRRPLARYTCSQCDKVCKTVAALNCHLKRHESSGNIQQMPDIQSHNFLVPDVERQKEDSGIAGGRHAQPTSVINYSKTDFLHTEKQAGKMTEEQETSVSSSSTKLTTTDRIQSSQLPVASSVVNPSPRQERSMGISPNLPSVLVMNVGECLDFRTPEKRSLDTQEQRTGSFTRTDRGGQFCQVQNPLMDEAAAAANLSLPMSLPMITESVSNSEVERNLQRHNYITTSSPLNNLQEAQDLRVVRPARSIQAEDLSMQSVLARERDLSQQTSYQYTTIRNRTMDDVVHIVPKQEPLSPVPSPTCSVIQTAQKAPVTKQLQLLSPCHSPGPLNLQLRPHSQPDQAHQVLHYAEKQISSTSSDHGSGLSSFQAAMQPQVSRSKSGSKDNTSSIARNLLRESGYPIQDFALPLIIPGGYCSGKNQEDQILMSYPPTHLSFGALGKMVPHNDSTKLPFYPDPYHLLYGPQLLPYPYNLAALPMALNMVGTGDKVEPLSFLPTLYNYAAVGAPFTGTMPQPLVLNPSLYNNISNTKRDDDNP